MKKILIIGGSIAGGLLALLLAAFIIFPGLSTYVSIKKECEHIDEPMAEFEAVSPGADFKEYSIEGLKLKVPGSWTEDTGFYDLKDEDANSTITILARNRKTDEETFSELLEDYDPWKEYKYEEDEYRHFFDSIGEKVPQYGLADCMVFCIRDCVTAKDCLKLRDKDKDVFCDVAAIKEEAFESEDMWKMKGTDFTAYVGHPKISGISSRIWNVNISVEERENDYINVLMVSDDEHTVKQVIGSIELDK